MKEEIALWKQRIAERKAKGQTVLDWCKEHNVSKGSYNYWRKQVKHAEEVAGNRSSSKLQPVTFAKVKTVEPVNAPLQLTWQDVNIQLFNSQEAHVAAEVISHLRRLC